MTGAAHAVRTSPRTGSAGRSRWPGLALAGICVLATALYAWRITSEDWGNPYYAAAVKSMQHGLTNFVFGSFDPVGVVTVDKPPLALWAMVLSTAVFGFHSWSVLLPQVVEGVATVFLLHRAVRRWAGEHAALIAALVLALTPITVAIDRDSNPDTMMVLLLVAAAYAFTRSVERGARHSTRWLMLAALLVGLGFVAKMLQAWIVVPAFALAYLVGASAPVARRVLRVLGAAAVMLAGSMWWVALTALWPDPKPYIGGSTDGSVLNLVIGYNGLGRIFGSSATTALLGGPGSHGGPGHGGHGGFGGMGGTPGITRMFGEQVGGQISWLLPLCAVVLVVAVVTGWRSRRSADPARLAGWILWGGWLVLVAAVLSFMRNQFHPYYTSEMAPAIAAVTGAGLVLLWRRYRHPEGYGWLLLPAVVVVTAAWAWVLISRDPAWNGWLRYPVAAVAVVAVALLVIGRLNAGRQVALLAGAVSAVALVLAPAGWSVFTAFSSSQIGAMAQAGPPRSMFGGAHRIGGSPAANEALRRLADQFSRGQLPPQLRAAAQGGMTAEQRKILAYAQTHSAGAPIALAVEGGARGAEPYLLNTDATVVGMGGFSGGDPAPTPTELVQWVHSGRVRFVLLNDDHQGGGRGSRSFLAAFGRSAAATQRTSWVQHQCTPVNPGAYGGSGAPQQTPLDHLAGAQVLYDCGAR